MPFSHRKQALPVDGWNLPIGQSLQAVEALTAYLPWEHSAHPAALYTAEYDPTWHSSHGPAPVLKLPGEQAGVGLAVGLGVGPWLSPAWLGRSWLSPFALLDTLEIRTKSM